MGVKWYWSKLRLYSVSTQRLYACSVVFVVWEVMQKHLLLGRALLVSKLVGTNHILLEGVRESVQKLEL